jgi:hypothetical protein
VRDLAERDWAFRVGEGGGDSHGQMAWDLCFFWGGCADDWDDRREMYYVPGLSPDRRPQGRTTRRTNTRTTRSAWPYWVNLESRKRRGSGAGYDGEEGVVWREWEV